MYFAFHCFAMSLPTPNVTVQSENIMTNTIENNFTTHNRNFSSMLWLRKADYAVFGRILLILGIATDVVALMFPVFVYFYMTRCANQKKRAPISKRKATPETSILKLPGSSRKFYPKLRIKKARTKFPLKKYNSTENSNNSREGQASGRSSLKYPIHSSDMSLLTAVKRDCKILFPPSAEDVIVPVGENMSNKPNESTDIKDSYVFRNFNSKDIQTSELQQKEIDDLKERKYLSKASKNSSNLSQNEREDHSIDEFSDNLKHYWPKYVTALQKSATLQRKNQNLLDYYKPKKSLNFFEENDGYDKTKKDSETTITQKKNNTSARYLRVEPPMNLDDPWISDEIRKKFNIPTPDYLSQRTMGSKYAFPNYSPCDYHQLYEMYDSCDFQGKKNAPPFNLGERSCLPPQAPHSVLAEERRIRLNRFQCFQRTTHCLENEVYKKTLHKAEEFVNKVTLGCHSAIIDQKSSSSSDQNSFKRNKFIREYQQMTQKKELKIKRKGQGKEKNHKNEDIKPNTTVVITLPKCVDMSRPASVPPASSDNLINKSYASIKRLVSSDVQNLHKTRLKDETKASDSTHETNEKPPPVPQVSSKKGSKSSKTFCKSACLKKQKDTEIDGSSDDTVREMTTIAPDDTFSTRRVEMKETEKSPLRTQDDRPPTKKRLQQEEMKRQKMLALEKKKELHKKKREEQKEHKERFKNLSEVQKQRYQLESTYITSEKTTSKPWELKDFLEYERQELERRHAGAGGKMTDSLTSGTFKDRYSPYRMRHMDESFMESVHLGRKRVYCSNDKRAVGISESISSGIESSGTTKLLGPVFVKDELLVKGKLPEYVFYNADEKVKPVKDKTFYTMEYKE